MTQNDDLHEEIDQLARKIELRIRSNEELLAEVEFDPRPRGLDRIVDALFR